MKLGGSTTLVIMQSGGVPAQNQKTQTENAKQKRNIRESRKETIYKTRKTQEGFND
jgi:hypothetical protein